MIVWAHIAETLETGAGCALVTVARAEGSTPREAGARMVVRQDGAFFGTIGGGSLEYEAIKWAREGLAEKVPGLTIKRMSLGPDLGQCCGGRTDIAIEVLGPGALDTARQLAAFERTGGRFSTVARIVDHGPIIRSIEEAPDSPDFELDGHGRLRERFGMDRRPVFLFGAGHVGRALVLALAPLPFQVTWIDSRAEQFPSAVPSNTQKRLVDRPAEVLAHAPASAFILAMTHSHAQDEDIMAAALAQQRFAYCGVIGSRTKRARFVKRLKQRGIPEAIVASMVCPIGLPSVRSKLPAAIAAGVAADLLLRDEAAHQQAGAGKGLAQQITHGQ
ncbi:xanthine dehydrogenase accessory protein XdhC [Roseibium aquae]|uniref:Xanthine dehydrogenase accessory protein XdhC n=1 Tax=Roseibium aquae TaxID=1323746 RepID=A0A916TIJ9_9HYPH|nr:xanthine dehydrogenase accessory protein XdhC [Roseibium aquae]GGB45139.1 xanthine dehydrogenase accessory protein XdhC [Roseibium aquae]